MGKTKTTKTEPSQRPHFEWQERVAARTDLSPAYKVVLWRLALHRNPKSGRCDPSYSTLAEECAVSERTAKRAIAKGEQVGIIAVARSGSGFHHDHNHYKFIYEGLSGVTPVGVSGVTPKGCPRRHCNNQSNDGTASLSPEREIAATAAAPGGPASYRRPPQWQGGRKAGRSAGSSPPGSAGGNDAAVRVGFDELRREWPRPWIDDVDADLRAYVKALQHDDHDTIMVGVKAWAKAFPNDKSRFLKPLAKWLDACGWKKEPPKQANGANGNGRSSRRRGGRKDDGIRDLRDEAIRRMAEKRRAAQ
jgi:hypothetical protein